MHPSFTGPRRHAAAALLACAAAILVACGGGGDGADPSAQATETATSYDSGPISGFGSVIVNGVRYDDSSATVLDDDDGGRTRDALKLGMMVEIDGARMNRAAGLGKALRIRFGSEIVGPVDSVDVAAGTLQVMGQPVQTTASTVFDDRLAGGLAALTAGTVVEVYALFDAASGHYVATRIEDEAGTAFYKLRGVIADLDPVAETFTIGGQVISYAGLPVAERPNALANGQRVRVRLQTTQVAGQWVAVALRPGLRKPDDRQDAHLRGTVTAFTTTTAFEVNGMTVDASGASFPDGIGGVVLGAQVEVEGQVVNGVLVATKVELDAHHAAERHRFELHGAISALDTVNRSFTLRGVRVSYGSGTVFRDGSEAQLADGRRVEVRGTPSADRTTLLASLVDFED